MSQDFPTNDPAPPRRRRPPPKKSGPRLKIPVPPDLPHDDPEHGSPHRRLSTMVGINFLLLLVLIVMLGLVILRRGELRCRRRPRPAPDGPVEGGCAAEVDQLKAEIAGLTKKLGEMPAPADPTPQIKSLDDKVADLYKTLAETPARIEALNQKVEAAIKSEAFAPAPKVDAIDKKVGELTQAIDVARRPSLARGPARRPRPRPRRRPTPRARRWPRPSTCSRRGSILEAKEAFARLQAANPDDARVWYFSALANGLATRDWKGESERLVDHRRRRRRRPGSPDRGQDRRRLRRPDRRPPARTGSPSTGARPPSEPAPGPVAAIAGPARSEARRARRSLAGRPSGRHNRGSPIAPRSHHPEDLPMTTDAKTPRREFLRRCGAAAAAGGLGFAFPMIVDRRVLGGPTSPPPSERIRVGFIGVGNQGTANLKAIQKEKAAEVVAVCDVDKDHLAKAKALAESTGRPCSTLRRLPAAARRQVDRRRPDHHARPLARPADHRRLRRRQGRLLREAAGPDRRRGQGDGRGRPEGQADRPDREPAALRRPVPPGLRAGPLGPAGQDQVGPGQPAQGQLRRPGRPRLGPPARARLPDLARPGARSALQRQARPLPLPVLLGLLRRPDDQLRRPPPRHRPVGPRPRRERAGLDRGDRPVPQGRLVRGPRAERDRLHLRRRDQGLSATRAARPAPTSCSRGRRARSPSRAARSSRTRPRSSRSPSRPGDVHLYVSKNHHKNWLDCIKSRELPICDVAIGHRSATVCHLGNIAVRARPEADLGPGGRDDRRRPRGRPDAGPTLPGPLAPARVDRQGRRARPGV